MAVTTITYTYAGEDPEKTSTYKLNLSTSVTLANAAIWAQEIAKLAEPFTEGVLTNISMSVDVGLPAGIRTAAVDGARVEHGALFSWRTVNGYPTSARVPAIVESIVQDDTHVIDQEDDDVAAWLEAIVNGFDLSTALPVAGTGTVGAVDTHADSIATTVKAKESFKA